MFNIEKCQHTIGKVAEFHLKARKLNKNTNTKKQMLKECTQKACKRDITECKVLISVVLTSTTTPVDILGSVRNPRRQRQREISWPMAMHVHFIAFPCKTTAWNVTLCRVFGELEAWRLIFCISIWNWMLYYLYLFILPHHKHHCKDNGKKKRKKEIQ